jgi:hypothetical protein
MSDYNKDELREYSSNDLITFNYDVATKRKKLSDIPDVIFVKADFYSYNHQQKPQCDFVGIRLPGKTVIIETKQDIVVSNSEFANLEIISTSNRNFLHRKRNIEMNKCEITGKLETDKIGTVTLNDTHYGSIETPKAKLKLDNYSGEIIKKPVLRIFGPSNQQAYMPTGTK